MNVAVPTVVVLGHIFTLLMSLFYVSLFQSHLVSILFCHAQVEALGKTLMYVKVLNEELKKMNGDVQCERNNIPERILMLLFSYVIALSIQYKHRQTNTQELERIRANVACFTISFPTAQPSFTKLCNNGRKVKRTAEENQLNSKMECITKNFRLNL